MLNKLLNLSPFNSLNSTIHTESVELQLKPQFNFNTCFIYVERSGSGVEHWTLDHENPGSNPGCGVKTLGKFFHSTLLQFTQLNK